MKLPTSTFVKRICSASMIVGITVFGFQAIGPLNTASAYHPQISPWMRTHLDVMQSLIGEADAVKTARTREASHSSYSFDAFEQQQRAFPSKSIPASGYPLGLREARQVKHLSIPVNWQDLGPTYTPNAGNNNPHNVAASPVSGRMSALAVVPSTCTLGGCGTMYLGAASGGVVLNWTLTAGTPANDAFASAIVLTKLFGPGTNAKKRG